MLLPLLALLACEVDLALTAGAIGLGLRGSHRLLTFGATAAVAGGFAIAIFLVWALWFVAPGCIGEEASLTCVNDHAASRFAYLGLGALAQWIWLLGVALAARRVTRNRKLALISG